jgi:hypothetical protein
MIRRGSACHPKPRSVPGEWLHRGSGGMVGAGPAHRSLGGPPAGGAGAVPAMPPAAQQTVHRSNTAVRALRVGRNTKYRALTELERAGVLTVKARNGHSVRVTLHWFP